MKVSNKLQGSAWCCVLRIENGLIELLPAQIEVFLWNKQVLRCFYQFLTFSTSQKEDSESWKLFWINSRDDNLLQMIAMDVMYLCKLFLKIEQIVFRNRISVLLSCNCRTFGAFLKTEQIGFRNNRTSKFYSVTLAEKICLDFSLCFNHVISYLSQLGECSAEL